MKLPYSHNFFSENVTSDLKGANATSFPLLENEKGMRGWRRKGVFNLCFCFCLFYLLYNLPTNQLCTKIENLGRFQKVEIRRGWLFSMLLEQ